MQTGSWIINRYNLDVCLRNTTIYLILSHFLHVSTIKKLLFLFLNCWQNNRPIHCFWDHCKSIWASLSSTQRIWRHLLVCPYTKTSALVCTEPYLLYCCNGAITCLILFLNLVISTSCTAVRCRGRKSLRIADRFCPVETVNAIKLLSFCR